VQTYNLALLFKYCDDVSPITYHPWTPGLVMTGVSGLFDYIKNILVVVDPVYVTSLLKHEKYLVGLRLVP
jgi:hypothetical protein